MNVEDINIGDEVYGNWTGSYPVRVTHIEGYLVIGRDFRGEPAVIASNNIREARRPKTALGYERVYSGDCGQRSVYNVVNSMATHVVTHWSDGTCTLDTIAAFREAHQ